MTCITHLLFSRLWGLRHTPNKKKTWFHQPPLSARPMTSSNSWTAAIPDHVTLSLLFLPLVSALHIPNLQVCALLCQLLCQLPSVSHSPVKTLVPDVISALLGSQAGRYSIKRADPERPLKGPGFCLPPGKIPPVPASTTTTCCPPGIRPPATPQHQSSQKPQVRFGFTVSLICHFISNCI